ncbi:PQQ-binding-like beta-propeller repeat protein [Cellulomonas sp. URHD0024]|uniref:outer membrane protein assembly factor BamB family protein n=1 Tax=Cellulomonas sp. URHD0024 TaxID=1302620 RepID=UPI00041C0F2F|nr:PQQ-binding-like beta-propeller repeat protein [Cellulomonas sp. URHD0024]
MTGRMREVELVDDVDVHVPAAPARGAPSAAPAARSWPRRHALWLVPALVLAVLGLVGTQSVLDARERNRIAALAEVPGVVPPASSDIGVIWRAPPELGTVMQGGAMVDGLMVGGAADDAGLVRVVALDPDTGATRWATPVTLPRLHPQPDGVIPSAWISCKAVQHVGRPLAGCASVQYGQNIVGLPDSTIWVLDPSDGHVLSERRVAGTSDVAFAPEAILVASRVDDTGGPARTDAGSVRWNVTATDPLDGTRLWTYTTPTVDVQGREDGPEAASASGGANMETFGDQVVLSVDGNAWILDGDGTLLRDQPLDPGSWIQGARAGAYVLSSLSSGAAYTGKLLLADGAEVSMAQTAAWLSVDDGSAPDVVLTVGDGPAGRIGITGRDAGTGDVLWDRPDALTAALLLDGVVYLASFDELSAVDARSGKVHWTTTLDHQPRQLSTDGRYLLVPGKKISLEAYALTDGRLAWSKDLTEAVTGGSPTRLAQSFQSSGRDPRLFVWMSDGAVAVLG